MNTEDRTQDVRGHGDDGPDPRAVIAQRVERIRICMLTTVEGNGELRSRPLTVQEFSPDGTLWFFIPVDGEVAREVAAHPRVNIAFADLRDNTFATLSGTASVEKDPAKIRELFNTLVRAWFPDGPDDPKLALLRVTLDEGEWWEPEGTKIGQFISIAKAALTRSPMDAGEHHKVEF